MPTISKQCEKENWGTCDLQAARTNMLSISNQHKTNYAYDQQAMQKKIGTPVISKQGEPNVFAISK